MGRDPDLVVDNLVGIFRSIFAAFWGPRTDDVLRAACLTLLRTAADEAPVSLADVPRLSRDAVLPRATGRPGHGRRRRARRVLDAGTSRWARPARPRSSARS